MSDTRKIRALEARRAADAASTAAARAASDARVATAGLREFAGGVDAAEATLKATTVGLVTREDFLARRDAAEAAAKAAGGDKKRAAADDETGRAAKKAAAAKLSFAVDDEDEDDEEDGAPAPFLATRTTLKDPTARTDFLPDADRDARAAELRAALRAEYDARQEALKAAPLDITFSYWDGAGHRRSLTLPRGASVGEFLSAARAALAPSFRELRACSAADLLYVKEDVILPHDVTFHHLISTKARGKSGPLFHFDVHDDVRIVSDATREKDESHAGKVVARSWYAKNRGLFPACRWEEWDPEKAYGGFTVKDTKRGK